MLFSSSDAFLQGFPALNAMTLVRAFTSSVPSEMAPLEGLGYVVGEALAIWGQSSVLFLWPAPGLGRSTQLLLSGFCSDYYQLAKERARLRSGVRALSSNPVALRASVLTSVRQD